MSVRQTIADAFNSIDTRTGDSIATIKTVITKKSQRRKTRTGGKQSEKARSIVLAFLVALTLASTGFCHFLLIKEITLDNDSLPPPYKNTENVDGNNMLPSMSRSHPSTKKVIDHLKKNVGINFLALDFDQTILDIHTGGQWKGSLDELFPHIRPVYSKLILDAITNDMEVAVVTFSCQTKFVRGVLDHIVNSGLYKEGMDLKTLESMGVMGVGNVVDTSHRIPIRGGDRSWRYNGSGSSLGKQPHMASAVEELEARREEDYLRAKAVAEASDNRKNSGVRTPPPNSSKEQQTTPSSPVNTGKSTTSSVATIALPEPITRKTTLLLDDDSRNIRHALQNEVRAVWFNPKKPHNLLPELMNLE